MEIRNIAIIAHVDHGKTTLTDAILRQTNMVTDNTSMDSNDIEKERGITIYSKNTSIYYKDTKINILDTPGHAAFGSEVERVLRSIDSVLLIVDAAEGAMPQTKFVLKKSLELKLNPILVLNKIDKKEANIDQAIESIYELFLDLGASDEQLDFKIIYAIAKDGVAKVELEDELKDLTPLLDTILENVQASSNRDSASDDLQGQVFNLAYDNFLGRMGIFRIYKGKITVNQTVYVKDSEGNQYSGKITKLLNFEGLQRKEVTEVLAGDIAMFAGIPDIYIGKTITSVESMDTLPEITIDEPTISFQMFVNNSPFAGRSGKYLTSRQIRERLEKELEVNVGLKVDFLDDARFKIYGRGELHLAVLIENMRREGFELSVSPPEVILKKEGDKTLEPFEEVFILTPEEYSGSIITKLGKRRGIMTNNVKEGSQLKITFMVPTRGLLGYHNEFVVDTRGEGILTSVFSSFEPFIGAISKTEYGSMISMTTGKALGFSLANLQDRGVLYIGATIEVYEGMVIGNTSKGEDMSVNPTKGKQLTNMRSSGADDAIRLTPPKELTLEVALGLMKEDEYLEVTPDAIRLRKRYLTDSERKRYTRKK